MNPMIAWIGLAAVALPIIIHIIMRRRRRPVSWGAMRFLEEALRRQRRRTRLEQLILLATRCLIVALIALALGRPMFGDPASTGTSAPRTLYVVIDDSLTSDIKVSGDPVIKRHLADAQAAIERLSAARGDTVAIVTLAKPAQAIVMPPTSDLVTAKQVLASITSKDSRADFAGALEAIAQDRAERTEVFEVGVYSEFRAGSFDARETAPRNGALRHAKFELASVAGDAPSNIRMKSLRVLQPPIFRGTERISVPMRLTCVRNEQGTGLAAERTKVDVSLASLGQIDRPAARAEVELIWADGQQESGATVFVQFDPQLFNDAEELIASATLADDVLSRDNVIRTSTKAWKRLETLIIAPGADASEDPSRYTPAQWLSLSLAPRVEESERRRLDSDIRVSVIDPARASQPAALSKAKALLIPAPDRIDSAGWAMIAAAAREGVFVLITPPRDPTNSTWTDELTRAGWPISIVGEPRIHEPALKLVANRGATDAEGPLGLLGAELDELLKPVSVFKSVACSGNPDSFDSLLSLSDGSPFVVVARHQDGGAGSITFMAAAPDLQWTDLPAKPLMLPLMQEMIRQGIGHQGSATAATVGERPKFPPGSVELREIGGTRAFSSAEDSPAIRDAGVFCARDGSGAALQTSVFNAAFDAGVTTPNSGATVSDWFRSTGAESVYAGGDSVAKEDAKPARDAGWSVPLLAVTIMLAAIEAFLARGFSHATMERTT